MAMTNCLPPAPSSLFVLEERFIVLGSCVFTILAPGSANLSNLFLENACGLCIITLTKKEIKDGTVPKLQRPDNQY